MKILLQDNVTLLFVRTLDHWTPDPSDALAFDTLIEAVIFCATHKLRGLHVTVQRYGKARSTYPPQQTDQITNFPFC